MVRFALSPLVGLFVLGFVVLGQVSAQGCPNSALSFDGVDDWARVSHVPLLGGFGDFTWECWFRSTDLGPLATLIEKDQCSGEIWLGLSSGYIKTWVVDCSNGIPATQFVADGTWHHVALSRTGTMVRVYVDGLLDTAATRSGTAATSTNPVCFGVMVYSGTNTPIPGHFFTGDIDEIRLWNLARTQQQILTSLSVALAGNELGLIGYWRLDEATGQVLTDSSATGANGNLGSSIAIESSDPIWNTTSVATVCPASPEYQVNSLNAHLDINGILGTQLVPATVTVQIGMTATLGLVSSSIGQPWDLGYGLAPLVPASAGALTFSSGQIVNLDLTDPTISLLFNFLQGPSWGPAASLSVPISVPFATAISAQMIVVTPSMPSGIALSQPVRLVVQ